MMRRLLVLLIAVMMTSCLIDSRREDRPLIGYGSEEPSLIVSDNGLILSWMEPYEDKMAFNMSVHDGIKWSSPKQIIVGDDWFVNWADYPAIVANGNNLCTFFAKE